MDVNVHNLSKEEKLSLILSNTENSAIRASAKFCDAMLMYMYVIFSLVSHKS